MERKVYVENLPKHKKGTNKGKIDWNNTVGSLVDFTYDDITGQIEIIDYKAKTRSLIIKYNDKIFWEKPIKTGHFQNCVLGYYLGIKTSEFKHRVNSNFVDDKRNIKITDRKHEKSKRGQDIKWYKYTCNKCGWIEGWIEESHLIKGGGCACCAGKVVVPEINSIWAKAPWMMKWIPEEDAKKYTPQSNKKIKVICPDCGLKKNIRVCDLYKRKSIGCKYCGDGVSYSEKFISNLLLQLEIKFQTQYSPSWANSKRYDFYIPESNAIIEVHGEQHYSYTGFNRSLEEEQNNDQLKRDLAFKNGIINYIVIDCAMSNVDYIKKSVFNSILNSMYDLKKINFEKCDEFALTNLAKDISFYWKNKSDEENIDYVASLFNLSKQTITTYLKQGTKLGWCNYDAKEEMGCKECVAYDLNGNVVLSEYSARELARKMTNKFGVKFDYRNISLVCLGKRKTHRGFIFKYN